MDDMMMDVEEYLEYLEYLEYQYYLEYLEQFRNCEMFNFFH